MTLEELNEIKAQVKAALSDVGYKRWEKHMVKCLKTLPMKEARKEMQRCAQEIYETEMKLHMVN